MSPCAPRRLARHVLLDLTPLRRSRDYRALIAGLGVSVLGNQLTTVAVPFQVYAITRSSLVVGLVSLAQLFPLIFGSLLGGSLVDAVDRRKLLLVVEAIGALLQRRRSRSTRTSGPRCGRCSCSRRSPRR